MDSLLNLSNMVEWEESRLWLWCDIVIDSLKSRIDDWVCDCEKKRVNSALIWVARLLLADHSVVYVPDTGQHNFCSLKFADDGIPDAITILSACSMSRLNLDIELSSENVLLIRKIFSEEGMPNEILNTIPRLAKSSGRRKKQCLRFDVCLPKFMISRFVSNTVADDGKIVMRQVCWSATFNFDSR